MALFDKPQDLDPNDCFIPDCDETGVIETVRQEPFIGQDGECVFCSGTGPVDRCYERYSEELAEILSGIFMWIDENCYGSVPPLPGIKFLVWGQISSFMGLIRLCVRELP